MNMKRITVTLLSLIIVTGLFAQSMRVDNPAKIGKSTKGDYTIMKKTRDAVLSEEFETWPATDWTIVEGENSQGTQHWHQITMDAPYNGVAGVLYDDNGDATARPQDEWLISPEFVVPADGAYLRFYLYTSVYWFIDPNDNADVNVNITIDDGTTWELLVSEETIEGLETYEWIEVLINLSDYAGETAKIAFQYVGQDAAQTMVDMVEVFSQPSYDVQLDDVAINFNYVDDPDYHVGGTYHLSGHFSRIPKPVLEENNTIMLFNAIVYNFGVEEATVNCEVKVLDPNNDEVYSQTQTTTEALASGATDTLDIGWSDETLFSMDEYIIGDYKVIYNLSIEGQTDEVLSNNTDTVIIEATEDVYSRALGRSVDGVTGPSAWESGAAGDEMLVSYHMMFPEAMEVGDNVEVTSIDVYLHEDCAVDQSFNASISYYDSELGDWMVIGSTPIFNVSASDVDQFVNLTFEDPIMIAKNADNFVNVRLSVMVFDNPNESEYILFGTENVPTEGWSTQWIHVGGSFGTDSYTISNFTDEVPLVSLNIDFNSAVDNLNVWNDFNVYPNPANEMITVENVENATIEVFNMLGKRMAVISDADFRNNIDMSAFAEGTYVVRVTGNKGTGVRKVNIIK